MQKKISCQQLDLRRQSFCYQLLEKTKQYIVTLEDEVNNAENVTDSLAKAYYYRDKILVLMNDLRKVVDMMEEVVSKEAWPIPTYTDLLFGI